MARRPASGYVFSELKNRGVEDVLIVVCDGLKGLPEAITTTCERTVMQQYIVHRIRNSFRYAGRQHRHGVVNTLKPFTRPRPSKRRRTGAPSSRPNRAAIPGHGPALRVLLAEFVPFLEYDAEIRGALHDDRERVNQRNDTEGR